MSKVYSHMVMSLDGYIADPGDGIDELFGWYGAGDVPMSTSNKDISFTVDAESAELLATYIDGTGALVCGRRLFDITDGWGDNHPVGAPFVVVTHNPPADAGRWTTGSFAGSVEAGIAEAVRIAGDKDVVVSSADIARQALDAGLLDEVHISLAPVLLGSGIPYFAKLAEAPHRFDDPVVVQGKRVTHLMYKVRH